MSKRKELRRIHVQAGCTDRMGRVIGGVFVVYIDQTKMVEQMEQAYNNRSNKSCSGALVVEYQQASPGQAQWVAAHPGECRMPLEEL